VERRGCGLFEASIHLLGKTDEIHEKPLSDSIRAPPEYKSEALPSEPAWSVEFIEMKPTLFLLFTVRTELTISKELRNQFKTK
jgi:hypothetical protein